MLGGGGRDRGCNEINVFIITSHGLVLQLSIARSLRGPAGRVRDSCSFILIGEKLLLHKPGETRQRTGPSCQEWPREFVIPLKLLLEDLSALPYRESKLSLPLHLPIGNKNLLLLPPPPHAMY